MSRALIPSSSPLPRRAVLMGAVATPLALAATGQSLSADPLALAGLGDDRLAQVDRLIWKIEQTCVAQAEASHSEHAVDEDGDNIFEAATKDWCAAQDALTDYANALSAKTPHTLADAIVLAKIADYWLVDDAKFHVSDETNPSIRGAVRAVLAAAAIEPYEAPVDDTKGDGIAEPAVLIEPHKPSGVDAGEAIIEIREHYKKWFDNVHYEMSIEGEPGHKMAVTISDASEAELVAFGDTVLGQIGKSWGQREDFVVWGELLLAHRHELASIDDPHDRAGMILQKLLQRARETGDELVEEARRWRMLQEAANI